MYTTLVSVALFAATAITGALAGFAISTPQFTQCQEATFSWEKTVGPYHVVVVKADDPCGDPVIDLGEIDKTSISWPVKLPGNTKVQLYVEDSGDSEAWSGVIEVHKSDDASCVSADTFKDFGLTPPTSSAAHSSTFVVAPTPSSTSTQVVTEPQNSGLVPIGAANAGNNPFSSSGTRTMHQISAPILAICALFAAFVLVL
ncbi:hypothetical protein AMATHDRAFT_138875 [Amanita thiersii Skay4041]|uniref:Uncharacterized protein n=1 Tax=Amanita thiersii Skay4041 TaxID=703135 RepID=A0A2A9NWZ7_9AGAR|nr:hypothetical protein AMATHDRAFT_138875 [Amanita thiersii Skay4041]